MTRRSQSRRARVARRVALSIVLGAATTVGVAWGAAFGASRSVLARSETDVSMLRAGGEQYHVHAESVDFWWATRRTMFVWPMAGLYEGIPALDQSTPEARAAMDGIPWVRERQDERQGWPLRCLSFRTVRSDFDAGPSEIELFGAISFETDRSSGARGEKTVRLGARPIWLALLADVLIFALAWFGVLSGLASLWGLRTRRRVRRGLCPKCAYDLAGDTGAGCPECGWGRTGPVLDAPSGEGRGRDAGSPPGAAPPPIA